MKQLSLLLATLFFSLCAAADSTIYIDVGQAKVKKSVLALPPLKYLGSQPSNSQHIQAGLNVFRVINNDLAVSGLFTTVLPSAYLEDPNKIGLRPWPGEPNGFKFENWKTIGTDFLVRGGYTVIGDQISLDVFVYHVPGAKALLAKTYRGPLSAYRKMAHTFSDDLMKVLTGKQGIYQTRIVASREDVVPGRTSYKEIVVLDWDGANEEPITANRTISISPAWSTKGDKIAYTQFALHTSSRLRNADLFIYDLKERKRMMVSYRKGLNSGANFLPGDQEILLTMSSEDGQDIYRMNVDGSGRPIPLTHGPNKAINVEPAISSDGKKIAFSSDRSGKAMIYIMNADGSNPKRLTFAGTYNSTPAWSPDGSTLAIAILDVNHFDIFTIKPDGTALTRLTDAKKPNGRPANNENPSWSPDGSHISYVSDRTGNRQIYIINADGTNERRVTNDRANWDRPKWSPYLR
jgi:TolB protein